MTNDLGHELARFVGAETTLGAYRRSTLPWITGALIDVWTRCARGEIGTGVPWPHAFFIQTIGGADGGSIFCPACRAELAAKRGASASPSSPALRTAPAPQGALPF